MSGTYAVLSFSVGEPGTFVRAEKAWINGVHACIGPCPNEQLGIMDVSIREKIDKTSYENVWGSTDLEIEIPAAGSGHPQLPLCWRICRHYLNPSASTSSALK